MAPRGRVLLGLCVLGALSMVAAEKTNMEECTAFTFSSNKGTKVLKNLPADKLAQMKGSVDSWQKWKGKTETSVSQIMIEFNANKMANKEREANGEEPVVFDTMAKLQEYAKALFPFAIPGLAMMGFTIVTLPFLFCARICCQKCCCKASKDKEDYGCMEKGVPVILFNVMCLVCIGFSVAANIGIGGITQGAVTSACEMASWVDQMDGFLGNVTPAFQAVNAAMEILDEESESPLRETMVQQTVMDEIWNAMKSDYGNEATFLGGFDVLLAAIEDAQAVVVADGACTSEDANWGSNDYSELITAQSRAAVFLWQGTNTMVTTKVADNVDALYFGSMLTDMAFTMARNMTSDDLKQAPLDMRALITEQVEGKGDYAYALFITTYFMFLNGIFVIVAWMTKCCELDDKIADKTLDCAWMLHMIVACAMFAVAGVMVPVAILSSDVCKMFDELPDDIGLYASSWLQLNVTSLGVPVAIMEEAGFVIPTAVTLMSACMAPDTTQPDALFDAMYGAPYGPVDGILGMDFGAWDTTFDAGGMDTTSYDELYGMVGALSGGCATAVEAAAPGLQAKMAAMWRPTTAAGATWTWDNTDATMRDYEAPIGNQDAPFLEHVFRRQKWQRDVLETMMEVVQDARTKAAADGGCGFFREQWDAVVAGMCQESLGGVGDLVQALLVIAFLSWPQTALAIIIGIRVFGDGQTEQSGVMAVDNRVTAFAD